MDGELVLSEIHIEQVQRVPGLPQPQRFHYRAPVTSNSSSSDDSSSDEEDGVPTTGDAAGVRRRPRLRHLLINHAMATPISQCGQQIWRGSCLLADLALSPGSISGSWHALELGCGAGLLAALSEAQLRCPLFVATDCESTALKLAASNVEAARAAATRQDSASAASRAARRRSSSANSISGSTALLRLLSWFALLGVDADQLTHCEMLQLLNGQQVDPNGAPAKQPQLQTELQPQQQHERPQHEQLQHQQQQLQQRQQQQPQHEQLQHQQQQHQQPECQGGQFSWTLPDLQQLLKVDTILAADVIYDPPLTEAFVHAAHCLMRWIQRNRLAPGIGEGAQEQQQQRPQQHEESAGTAEQRQQQQQRRQQQHGVRLLLAAEKRFNFTWTDADRARATAWEHFLSYVDVEGCGSACGSTAEGAAVAAPQHAESTAAAEASSSARTTFPGACQQGGRTAGRRNLLRGRPLPVPDQAMEYDRTPDLELWELFAIDPHD